MMKYFLLPLFTAHFFCSTCLASEQKTINDAELRQALIEAKLAAEKTLQYSEAEESLAYKLPANSYIRAINKLLGSEQESMTTSVPKVSMQEKTPTVAQNINPISKSSTLEERYAELEKIVPWFKDLEIAQALEIGQVVTFANPHIVQNFISNYFMLAQERRKKNSISEEYLNLLEQDAKNNEVIGYDFKKSAASNILPTINRMGITLKDIQKNENLKTDLHKIYANKYNKMGSTLELENEVKRKFENYKTTGAYK